MEHTTVDVTETFVDCFYIEERGFDTRAVRVVRWAD